jgi:CubicO group peptidase (beta-lactamase class C family)
MTRLACHLAGCFILIAVVHAGCKTLLLTAASQPLRPDALVGVWGTEQVFGPAVRGQLTIDARRPEWRARIDRFDLPVKRDGEAMTFSLPEDAGEFRGHVSADGKAISGDWIQPVGIVLNNRYATPVRFRQASASVWIGAVTPLDDRVSFYVSIQRAQDGFSAFIRNPELNAFRRRVYRVDVSDAHVTLTNAQNARDQLTGVYDPSSDRLSLAVLDARPPLGFTRRKGRDAAGFFPRAFAGTSYVYRKPGATADGWVTASLAEVAMDVRPVAALVEKILAANLQDNPVNIHSLLIARHGKLVLEEYFYGHGQEQTHDTRSASKTYGPVLVGLARDGGARIGPETRVYSLYPQLKPFSNWDERKNSLTLRHLMTMTSGLACDDNDDASPGAEDTMQSQRAQLDWYKYTLDLPLTHDPGGDSATYCSAGMNLIGGVVKQAAERWLPEFFEEHLARPLQFHTYHMNLTPMGDAYMGGGLSVRPRDEIKLGQLYLSGGLWNGRRVVSRAWVEESTTPHSSFAPQMPGDLNHQYGYGWHLNPLGAPDRTYRSFSAGGNGGQIVMVIPELDLVVAFNGGSYGEFAKWYRWSLELVPQYIIPAATTTAPR